MNINNKNTAVVLTIIKIIDNKIIIATMIIVIMLLTL